MITAHVFQASGRALRGPRGAATGEGLLARWRRRGRERRLLARLDDHLLHDIGASRTWRDLEVAKPFWRE